MIKVNDKKLNEISEKEAKEIVEFILSIYEKADNYKLKKRLTTIANYLKKKYNL